MLDRDGLGLAQNQVRPGLGSKIKKNRVLYRVVPGVVQKFWEFWPKTRKKHRKFYSGEHTSW